MPFQRFDDRRDAGRKLAAELKRVPLRDPVVLALPRGGVPVAFEVAAALGAPLDVLVVRKLGAPFQPELAIGAVASGNIRVMNEDFEPVRWGIDPEAIEAIEAIAARELAELERRERLYRGKRPPPDLEGRDVILVDDGLATGASMRAAVAAVRARNPARVIVAVPAASPQAVRDLERVADRVIFLEAPPDFYAVGQFYRRFEQRSDAEVCELLRSPTGAADTSPAATPVMCSAASFSFFAPGESLEAGRAVAQAAGLELAPLEERTFDDGEFKLRPLESVRGRTVFVYQSLAGSAEMPAALRLLRLLFLLANLRDNGARRCIAVVPYLAYARKDRRTQPRDPVYTRYVAELLEAAGAQRLVALDVHNPAALDNAYRIPVHHLSALPILADHFARRFAAVDVVVASPDVGGVKRVQIFQELLSRKLGRKIDLVFVEKRRACGTVSGGTVVGLHRQGVNVIVLDDLCATGETLIRAAEACLAAGAAAVHAAVTHVPWEPGVENVLAAKAVASLTVTDSIGRSLPDAAKSRPGKVECLSVAPLLGEALARMRDGRPLAALLDRWPPAGDA